MIYYKYHKYRAKKTIVDGIKFDSKHESEVYKYLMEELRLGLIHDLRLQVKFEIIPKCVRQSDNKVVERACHYVADFVYYDNKDNLHVLDAKGFKTTDYKIKKKLMLYQYNIIIEEV